MAPRAAAPHSASPPSCQHAPVLLGAALLCLCAAALAFSSATSAEAPPSILHVRLDTVDAPGAQLGGGREPRIPAGLALRILPRAVAQAEGADACAASLAARMSLWRDASRWGGGAPEAMKQINEALGRIHARQFCMLRPGGGNGSAACALAAAASSAGTGLGSIFVFAAEALGGRVMSAVGRLLVYDPVPWMLYTHNCRGHSYRCFFEPLSSCDGLRVGAKGTPSLQSLTRSNIKASFKSAPGAVHPGGESVNLHRTSSAVLSTAAAMLFLLQPSAQLAAHVQRARATLQLRHPYIAMHVRHGDKYKEARRHDLSEYMGRAEEMRAMYGVRNIFLMVRWGGAGWRRGRCRCVVGVGWHARAGECVCASRSPPPPPHPSPAPPKTDDPVVVKASARYVAHGWAFSFVNETRFNTDIKVLVKHDTIRGAVVVMDALADVFIAADSDFFIGTLSSNLGQVVLYLQLALYGRVGPYASLDHKRGAPVFPVRRPPQSPPPAGWPAVPSRSTMPSRTRLPSRSRSATRSRPPQRVSLPPASRTPSAAMPLSASPTKAAPTVAPTAAPTPAAAPTTAPTARGREGGGRAHPSPEQAEAGAEGAEAEVSPRAEARVQRRPGKGRGAGVG